MGMKGLPTSPQPGEVLGGGAQETTASRSQAGEENQGQANGCVRCRCWDFPSFPSEAQRFQSPSIASVNREASWLLYQARADASVTVRLIG